MVLVLEEGEEAEDEGRRRLRRRWGGHRSWGRGGGGGCCDNATFETREPEGERNTNNWMVQKGIQADGREDVEQGFGRWWCSIRNKRWWKGFGAVWGDVEVVHRSRPRPKPEKAWLVLQKKEI